MFFLTPEYRRELIRCANRDEVDADGVSSLLEYAEWVHTMPDFLAPEPLELYNLWKASFEEPEAEPRDA